MTEFSLTLRRTIPASRARVFKAWTTAELLVKWWGPDGVQCPGAQVDLRVGGEYRIGNRKPDGAEIWIVGTFEEVDVPRRLVYGWSMDEAHPNRERVTVEFREAGPDATEVVLHHERLQSEETREQHEMGWEGCLDGLTRHMSI